MKTICIDFGTPHKFLAGRRIPDILHASSTYTNAFFKRLCQSRPAGFQNVTPFASDVLWGLPRDVCITAAPV